MRISCKRSGSEMCDFSALSTEKQELVKMFVDYLQSDTLKHHGHGQGHHGHHGRFGKDGHGKFGHFGKHGMHGGRHGPHSMHGGRHGPHGHCRPHGLRGHHGHGGHGRPHGHCHRGRHGLHGKHGKFWAQWTVDLTEESDDSQNMVETGRNPSPPPAETTDQGAEGNNTDNCKCSRFGRRHGGRFGKWKLQKKNQVPVAENSSQTEDNTDNTQENLTEMVENINIDITE
ncbi:cold and drought-regulated protein CORA-like [Helicoverpa zea]|uniref:cold and drought-regulated protein CORA-like n=1 Tax=Helicoverpa zea TaxID=7113 RepID=UPI001F57986E|nr:cold and drought-regulated protein CORA-like [Helicoverpa zea]